ncbi:GEVED domain-containing protein, partial [Weeksella virosa]|uniref:GEVED domain-containing protein n=1 Tax=Weeksella virosa TaxID=1014 RepID=UPI0039E05FE6
MKRNASYEFSASTGAGWQYESVHVWIDYNHDGVFTEEEYTYIGSNPGGTVTNMITIPENALEGATRMRVRVFPMPGPGHPQAIAYGNEGACYDNAEYPYGEIEDYTVNIGELGLTNVNDAVVKLYPNPVHDVLTIESKTAIQSVEI